MPSNLLSGKLALLRGVVAFEFTLSATGEMCVNIEGIPIGSIWSFLRWLPKWYLRKRFPQDRLARLVYVDIRPRHESVAINLGPSADFRIWLQMINLSPFEIELDRGEFAFWCGPKLKASVLVKKKIQPGEITSLFIEQVIPGGQADHAAINVNSGSCHLDGHMEFNCALHPFSKAFTLDGVMPNYINAHTRGGSA